MRALILLPLLALAACQTPQPVNKPCGIVNDALHDVRGATPTETRRIDRFFERGVGAGCWDRNGRLIG